MAEADPFVNVHEAKTNFSKLLERAHGGEEIILAKAGVPYAKLVPYEAPRLEPRKPGRLKGLLSTIPDSVWFEPMSDEELDIWEGRHDPLV